MSERAEAYFRELDSRSSEDLDRSAVEIGLREKQDVARQIAHIAVIRDRKYHLELGYRGIFEYCVKRLRLGEGTVSRRTQVAGVCREFPQILEALFSNRLNLTGASLIAPHLTADNVETLIAEAQRRTKRELEEFLVTLKPKKEYTPSIRKQPVSTPAAPDPQVSEEPPHVPAPPSPAVTEGTPGEMPTSSAGGARSYDLLKPAAEERYNIRFSAAKEVVDKLERAAEVLNIASPHRHIEEIFAEALEALLEQKDPKRKQERRRRREAKKRAVRLREETQGEVPAERGPATPTVSRRIPPEVRERVLERAAHQCEYRGPDGTRCTSRTGLQVDHSVPFAVCHTHDEDQLRALCPAHNRFTAERYFGGEFIQGKIEARREKGRPRVDAYTSPGRFELWRQGIEP